MFMAFHRREGARWLIVVSGLVLIAGLAVLAV
jgi:hypothetical protein